MFLTQREMEGDYEYIEMRPGSILDFIADVTEALLKDSFPQLLELQLFARQTLSTEPLIFALSIEQIEYLEALGLEPPESSEEVLEKVATYAASLATEKTNGELP